MAKSSGWRALEHVPMQVRLPPDGLAKQVFKLGGHLFD
jgi:hypothetical protein